MRFAVHITIDHDQFQGKSNLGARLDGMQWPTYPPQGHPNPFIFIVQGKSETSRTSAPIRADVPIIINGDTPKDYGD